VAISYCLCIFVDQRHLIVTCGETFNRLLSLLSHSSQKVQKEVLDSVSLLLEHNQSWSELIISHGSLSRLLSFFSSSKVGIQEKSAWIVCKMMATGTNKQVRTNKRTLLDHGVTTHLYELLGASDTNVVKLGLFGLNKVSARWF